MTQQEVVTALILLFGPSVAVITLIAIFELFSWWRFR